MTSVRRRILDELGDASVAVAAGEEEVERLTLALKVARFQLTAHRARQTEASQTLRRYDMNDTGPK